VIFVWDDVLEDPVGYRAAVLAASSHADSVALPVEAAIADAIRARFPSVTPARAELHRGPDKPAVISSPTDDWVALLFIDLEPIADSVAFWRQKATGLVRGALDNTSVVDVSQWTAWRLVGTLPNRMTIFPGSWFYSRGQVRPAWVRDDAMVAVKVFGQGELQVTPLSESGLIEPYEAAAVLH
jgi:hypothetical protein